MANLCCCIYKSMVQHWYLKANMSLCIDSMTNKINGCCMFTKDECLQHPSRNLI